MPLAGWDGKTRCGTGRHRWSRHLDRYKGGM